MQENKIERKRVKTLGSAMEKRTTLHRTRVQHTRNNTLKKIDHDRRFVKLGEKKLFISSKQSSGAPMLFVFCTMCPCFHAYLELRISKLGKGAKFSNACQESLLEQKNQLPGFVNKGGACLRIAS